MWNYCETNELQKNLIKFRHAVEWGGRIFSTCKICVRLKRLVRSKGRSENLIKGERRERKRGKDVNKRKRTEEKVNET